MNKFKVGDRVRWHTAKPTDNMTAVITSVRDDGHITFDWDDRTAKHIGSLDRYFTLLYPRYYEDFMDKIKDRLK